MIRLKTLQLQGFRRFSDPTTIVFPEKGLLLLDGDSGAGKSTILQAIAFAIDICPFPSTTLKSWSGEPLQVVLTVEADGQDVTIARGKKTFIQFGSEPPRTGAKALEEGLRSLFGLAPELIAALTYRPQDQLGLFLSKDDAEKKEFLGKVLGLSSIEEALEESDERRKKLQSELSFAQGVLAEREGGLRKALEGLTEVSPDPVDIGFAQRASNAQQAVDTLTAEVESLQAQVAKAVQDYTAKTAEVVQAKRAQLETANSLYKQVKTAALSKNAELEQSRETIRQQITKISVQLGAIPNLKSELRQTQDKLTALEKSECYVCHRPFTAEAAIDEERERIAALSQQIEVEGALSARKKALAEQLAGLVPFVDEREPKLASAVSKLENWLLFESKNVTDPAIIQLEQQTKATMGLLLRAKDDAALAKDDLHTYQQACKMKATMRARQEGVRALAVQQVDEAREKVAKLEADLNAERDFLHVLGKDGFLGAIFGEVLAEISSEANSILSKLQNTSHVSVALTTENAKGKKTITPVFYVDGNEATRHSGLSGGMGASADLAVDLGVVGVIERRLGQVPGWLALDESFNGMPRSTKESAIEILQQFAQDRLVLVVDHGSEMKAHFNKVLTVKLENGKSVAE